jgi:hypothetical protein
MLLRNGADPLAVDHHGKTALTYADEPNIEYKKIQDAKAKKRGEVLPWHKLKGKGNKFNNKIIKLLKQEMQKSMAIKMFDEKYSITFENGIPVVADK